MSRDKLEQFISDRNEKNAIAEHFKSVGFGLCIQVVDQIKESGRNNPRDDRPEYWAGYDRALEEVRTVLQKFKAERDEQGN